MSEWKEYKLGESPLSIIDGDRGKNYPSQEEFTSNGFCLFLSTKNVRFTGFDFSNCQFISQKRDDLLRKGKLKVNDLVLTTRGTIGNIGFFSKKVNSKNVRINSGMVIIRPNTDELLPIFNYYVFRFLQKDFLTFTTGSAQPQLPIRDLNEIEIKLPPLSEQRAIASVLSSLDDKIDLLHRQNQTLEKMAETLFRQWFLPNRQAGVEEAKEDWEEGTLNDLANFYNGKQRPKEIGTTPVYGGNGILGYSNNSNYSGKSIIIGRVGAYCGSLYYENKDIWVSDNALLVKAKHENQTHFLYYLLKTLDLNSMAEGSGHPLLTQTLLKSIEINLPPNIKIQEFDNQIEHVRNKTESNQTQIRTLEKLRDTLLPKLMSGEVRVEI